MNSMSTVSGTSHHEAPRLPGEPCEGHGLSPGPRRRGVLSRVSPARSSAGFSLIELLNVVMVIGVLAAIATPMLLTAVQRARETAAVAYMKSWPSAINLFYLDFDRFPATLAELEESGYITPAGPSLRLHYAFTLVQKVAGVPSATPRMARSGPVRSWWAAVTEWDFVGSAWAAHNPDHQTGPPGGSSEEEDKDKGHGNNPGGCDPDNPGQGAGGPCGGDGGSGGDGGGTAGNGGNGGGGAAGAGDGGAGSGWEGWANPVSGQGKHFYVDETGTIRFSMNAPAGADSSPI